MKIEDLIDQQIKKMDEEAAQILANANFVNGAKSMLIFIKNQLKENDARNEAK